MTFNQSRQPDKSKQRPIPPWHPGRGGIWEKQFNQSRQPERCGQRAIPQTWLMTYGTERRVCARARARVGAWACGRARMGVWACARGRVRVRLWLRTTQHTGTPASSPDPPRLPKMTALTRREKEVCALSQTAPRIFFPTDPIWVQPSGEIQSLENLGTPAGTIQVPVNRRHLNFPRRLHPNGLSAHYKSTRA